MDRQELVKLLIGDLNNRTVWEDKQSIWYEMRHDGIPRRTKPWPGAADLHYPLADSKIEDLKSYYVALALDSAQLAHFVSKEADKQDQSNMVAFFFDWELKERSNFIDELMITVDQMLEGGKSLLKITFDLEAKKLKFDGISAINVIAPPYARDLQTLNRFAHIIQMPVSEYKQQVGWNQDEDFIDSIKGNKENASQSGGQTLFEALTNLREGLTFNTNDETVLFWECYTRDEKGVLYMERISPQNIEESITERMKVPYDSNLLPFIDYSFERKTSGFYSSRGVCEMVAMEEAVCNKQLNESEDFSTLALRPLLVSDQPIKGTTNNIKWAPGQILDQPLQTLHLQPPAISAAERINMFAGMAERRVGTPTFAKDALQEIGGVTTDNKINKMFSMADGRLAMRALLFKQALGQTYKQAFSLIRQFRDDALTFYFEGNFQELDNEVLSQNYEIIPYTPANGITREMALNNAIAFRQVTQGDPAINQEATAKLVVEAYDPRIMPMVFVGSQANQADQAEEQAKEILLLEQSFPVTAKISDDHKVHIDTMLGREQMLNQLGNPSNKIQLQRKYQHAFEHLNFMKRKDPLYSIYKDKVEEMYIKIPKQMAEMRQNAQKQMLMAQQGGMPLQPAQTPPQAPQAQQMPIPQGNQGSMLTQGAMV